MFENFTRENRESPSTPTRSRAGRLEKGVIQKSNMHVEGSRTIVQFRRSAPSKWESTGRGHAGETTGQGERGGEDASETQSCTERFRSRLLKETESLNEGIQEYEIRMKKIARESYPQVELLKQVRG